MLHKHTTEFNSLKDLTITLGCDYLRKLNLGRNAQYSSKHYVTELLQYLSLVIEKQIVSDIHVLSLLTDESTDIAVLKKLILVGRCTCI